MVEEEDDGRGWRGLVAVPTAADQLIFVPAGEEVGEEEGMAFFVVAGIVMGGEFGCCCCCSGGAPVAAWP